jgi:hypothetical protein
MYPPLERYRQTRPAADHRHRARRSRMSALSSRPCQGVAHLRHCRRQPPVPRSLRRSLLPAQDCPAGRLDRHGRQLGASGAGRGWVLRAESRLDGNSGRLRKRNATVHRRRPISRGSAPWQGPTPARRFVRTAVPGLPPVLTSKHGVHDQCRWPTTAYVDRSSAHCAGRHHHVTAASPPGRQGRSVAPR